MYLRKVTNKEQAALFLDFPKQLHQANPNYIQPLDKDVEAIFDENKNKCFLHGKCTRWLLFNDKQQVIGRIAAFVNYEYLQAQPTGGIGFFECIDSERAAHYMFDYCRFWLMQQGIEAMDGPINFGERMNWWGLLLEGFHSPLYGMNYNPPYYKRLFESYGFQVYFYQDCYSLSLREGLPDKFYKIRDRIKSNDSYKVIPFCKKDLVEFAQDFTYIYNKSWQNHGEGKSIKEKEAVKLFKAMKDVLDEKTIWFTYHEGNPIACWLNLPDLNAHFKSLKGKFGPLEMLKFLWQRKFSPTRKLVGVLFGVVPEYQNKGIEAFMIVNALETIKSKTQYNNYEMQWVGDFNPKMVNFALNMGAQRTRQLATYRYLFDDTRSFYKHPTIS
eukprot:gene13819-16287_t